MFLQLNTGPILSQNSSVNLLYALLSTLIGLRNLISQSDCFKISVSIKSVLELFSLSDAVLIIILCRIWMSALYDRQPIKMVQFLVFSIKHYNYAAN